MKKEMMEMEGQQVEKKYPLANPLIVLIDKNSIWGGSNVQKKGIVGQGNFGTAAEKK